MHFQKPHRPPFPTPDVTNDRDIGRERRLHFWGVIENEKAHALSPSEEEATSGGNILEHRANTQTKEGEVNYTVELIWICHTHLFIEI